MPRPSLEVRARHDAAGRGVTIKVIETIEDAVGFYNTTAFDQSPAGLAGTPIALTNTQIANIGAFLRVLNVAFNALIASKRVSTVISIIDGVGNQSLAVQNGLLDLALAEVDDAIDLLQPVPLPNTSSRTQLNAARGHLQAARQQSVASVRRARANSARTQIDNANSALGSGVTYRSVRERSCSEAVRQSSSRTRTPPRSTHSSAVSPKKARGSSPSDSRIYFRSTQI